MNLKLLGQRIRSAREKLQMTQEDLAFKLGKTQNSISMYESGQRAIRLDDLDELASALEVPIAYFFGEEYVDEDILAILSQFPPGEKASLAKRLQLELDLLKQKVG